MEWVAIGPGAVRCGAVNPIRVSAAYELATNVLEALPGYFGIGALDVVSLELTFGFDLDTDQDHYEAVHDTLLGGSRLAGLMRCDEERVVEMQPMLAWSLDHSAHLQAQVEVRPRGKGRGLGNVESCSVYSTVKRTGPVEPLRRPWSLGARVGRSGGSLGVRPRDPRDRDATASTLSDLTGLRASEHRTFFDLVAEFERYDRLSVGGSQADAVHRGDVFRTNGVTGS